MDPSTTPRTGAPEPGARLDVTIERPAALGRGVAHVEGFALLVARGVPGEAVTVEVERCFPRHALARVVAVRTPVPERTEPACEHFAVCGGCDWQHLDYAAQLRLKRAVLTEQLERIGRLEPPPDWPLEPAPAPLGYRDRLDFVPAVEDGRYVPAFHDVTGQGRVPITYCRLAPEACTRLARAALEALQQAGSLPPPGAGPPPLQRLTVQATEDRQGRPALSLLLHLRAGGGGSEGQLRRAWRAAGLALWPALQADFPELAGLALQFPARLGRGRARRSGPTVAVLHGPARLSKRVAGRAYRVPHAAFFQVNADVAGRLVAHVAEAVQAALGSSPPQEGRAPAARSPVFDLYCGVGLFALPLAAQGSTVVGVDADREGLRAAEETARAEGLDGCTFNRADLERRGALERLLEQHGAPAVVVCDPPRRGLAAPLRTALLAAAPPALVYVSCDGGTFARDAAHLSTAYDLVELRGFDQFPQTHHLELVGTFRRRAQG